MQHFLDVLFEALIFDNELMKFHTSSYIPLRAITLLEGFIMAESAEIGRLMGLLGSAISTITT